MKPKVVILDAGTLDFSGEEPWAPLAELADVTRHDHTEHAQEAIVERCAEADVVITNKVPFDAATLEALPQLKLITLLATGYNNIDTAAARERGITVCNVPGYGNESVAQHTLALILELCNRVGDHAMSVRDGGWVRSLHICYWLQAPRELAELTVGLVGLGEIGRAVAERLLPYGCRLLAFTPSKRRGLDHPRFAWAGSMEELFEQSDIVSLHCPQTPTNAGFVNADLLARMKPGSYLINTARGTLVNEADLAKALQDGPLAAAALDVIAKEPMQAGHPLQNLPNVYMTPHLAWASEPARLRLLTVTADNLRAFLAGKPQNVVNA
ncbi:D-2-hydroxyacid dehydrogenase [Ruficoccus sp. ZRK36]|uniref:D-2-hydroxyacid dehydrogenase n=1 Tax=Ruficoccus sp. ZRK36 TaxID=2866311 RepID=UPI001C734967|nr:D-2-hydroxyacid dehydrogenase [Ruficoccus sp. ZRK36]QYY36688.1 D-2-hydroxyacid dehydrogenase [Ruficoccus sp. ZRK36]